MSSTSSPFWESLERITQDTWATVTQCSVIYILHEGGMGGRPYCGSIGSRGGEGRCRLHHRRWHTIRRSMEYHGMDSVVQLLR